MNLLYVILGIGLVSLLATVLLLWHAAMTAPIRNDWESSADQRWREYRERALGIEPAPWYVPDNILDLPHRHGDEGE